MSCSILYLIPGDLSSSLAAGQNTVIRCSTYNIKKIYAVKNAYILHNVYRVTSSRFFNSRDDWRRRGPAFFGCGTAIIAAANWPEIAGKTSGSLPGFTMHLIHALHSIRKTDGVGYDAMQLAKDPYAAPAKMAGHARIVTEQGARQSFFYPLQKIMQIVIANSSSLHCRESNTPLTHTDVLDRQSYHHFQRIFHADN